jgi:hypothetical protein
VERSGVVSDVSCIPIPAFVLEVSGTDSLTPLRLSVRCSVSLLSMCLKFESRWDVPHETLSRRRQKSHLASTQEILKGYPSLNQEQVELAPRFGAVAGPPAVPAPNRTHCMWRFRGRMEV